MPTYGYQCTSCKHEFQVFQAMKDAPISECPECAAPVKRLLYPVGVVFKGSGWYVTDSRKPEPPESSGSSANTSKPTESSKPGAETTAPATATSDSK